MRVCDRDKQPNELIGFMKWSNLGLLLYRSGCIVYVMEIHLHIDGRIVIIIQQNKSCW